MLAQSVCVVHHDVGGISDDLVVAATPTKLDIYLEKFLMYSCFHTKVKSILLCFTPSQFSFADVVIMMGWLWGTWGAWYVELRAVDDDDFDGIWWCDDDSFNSRLYNVLLWLWLPIYFSFHFLLQFIMNLIIGGFTNGNRFLSNFSIILHAILSLNLDTNNYPSTIHFSSIM